MALSVRGFGLSGCAVFGRSFYLRSDEFTLILPASSAAKADVGWWEDIGFGSFHPTPYRKDVGMSQEV